jgi:hypothetical protein
MAWSILEGSNFSRQSVITIVLALLALTSESEVLTRCRNSSSKMIKITAV